MSRIVSNKEQVQVVQAIIKCSEVLCLNDLGPPLALFLLVLHVSVELTNTIFRSIR